MAETPKLWWGTTSSSLQSEGVAPAADWSVWERSKRVPASNDGNGAATNHQDDFALLSSVGLSHVRLTLEWARIEPEPGRIDNSALDHYQDMLTSARNAGLRTIVTLQHGTLPGWFSEDTPGFRDPYGREYQWAGHVDRCAERFDTLVDMWVPIDDPIGWAIRAHLLGSRPPGSKNPEHAAQAVEGALLANHVAWSLLQSGAAPVMAVFGVPTIFGHGPESDGQRRTWQDLLFGTWISALRDGELHVPGMTPREAPEMAGTFDIIGLSHDHPIAIDERGSIHPYPTDDRRADTGFTPIVNELGELLSFAAAELPGRRLVVAAHGVATADDEWRERILQETYELLNDVVSDGLPVEGYLHDTGIDGYEGPYGFTVQKGLIGRGRDLKDSARWLQAQLT